MSNENIDDIIRDEKRIKITNEVFTPSELVIEILDKFPHSDWTVDSKKIWIDPSCGNGNFLIEAKRRLLTHGHSEEDALSRIYGVEIMEDNVEVCKNRLDPDKKYRHIIDKNIICADALRYHFRFDDSHPYDDETEQLPQYKELFE